MWRTPCSTRARATLIQYPVGNLTTSYTMPNTVTNIGMEAFYGSTHLNSVTIGTNVIIIGSAAFEYSTA